MIKIIVGLLRKEGTLGRIISAYGGFRQKEEEILPKGHSPGDYY